MSDMHASERDRIILNQLKERGFVSYRELAFRLPASPATLRRDLDRLQKNGKLIRVRGGAQLADAVTADAPLALSPPRTADNPDTCQTAKKAIGREAASQCMPGEAVIIDAGTTTLQMCPHLEPLGLQVLTNSLHIVGALMDQPHTGISLPGGVLFREKNILLNPLEDAATQSFHASKMFLSCAAISRFGLMQSDVILLQAERKLLTQADEVVLLADSTKFSASASHVLCALNKVHTVITDCNIDPTAADMVQSAGARLIIANGTYM